MPQRLVRREHATEGLHRSTAGVPEVPQVEREHGRRRCDQHDEQCRVRRAATGQVQHFHDREGRGEEEGGPVNQASPDDAKRDPPQIPRSVRTA